MRARTALYVTIAMIALAGVRAHAVTLEDVVELAQSGIGDVVLIELIEMDDVAYPLTPFRLRGLKAAGVSDQVLLALLRSGRSPVGGRVDRTDAPRGRPRRASRWSRASCRCPCWCQPGRREEPVAGSVRPGH